MPKPKHYSSQSFTLSLSHPRLLFRGVWVCDPNTNAAVQREDGRRSPSPLCATFTHMWIFAGQRIANWQNKSRMCQNPNTQAAVQREDGAPDHERSLSHPLTLARSFGDDRVLIQIRTQRYNIGFESKCERSGTTRGWSGWRRASRRASTSTPSASRCDTHLSTQYKSIDLSLS